MSILSSSLFNYFKKNNKSHLKGFAMAEIIMVLMAVGIASFLIAGLMKQLSLLGNKSAQTGVIFEFRNKVNAISKNPNEWLNKMRANYSVYAGCIPDKANSSVVFTCPIVAESDTLKSEDILLGKAAGPDLHIASTPMLDLLGDPLAGTLLKPLYLDSAGRPCESATPEKSCPLMSTGYFLRSNANINQNPGNVRFIVKLQRNLDAIAQNSSQSMMKPEYLSIELGTSWQDSSDSSPAGTVKLGYLTDGTPRFVNPLHSCAAGQIYIGDTASGTAICKSVITCGNNESPALSPSSGELQCMSNEENPCPPNQIFLGNFSGTGQPMCASANSSCTSPKIQMGIAQDGSAICKEIPICTATQKVAYNGIDFSCAVDTNGKNCAAGQIMTGVASDGNPVCSNPLTTVKLDCPDDHYVSGLESDGSVKCTQVAPPLSQEALNCPNGQYVSGLNTDGSVICKAIPGVTPTPPTGPTYTLKWKATSDINYRQNTRPSTTCPDHVIYAINNTCGSAGAYCRRNCIMSERREGRDLWTCQRYVCMWHVDY